MTRDGSQDIRSLARAWVVTAPKLYKLYGPFETAAEAGRWAEAKWPGIGQSDDDGDGWDVEVIWPAD